jgi:hypothetical protein
MQGSPGCQGHVGCILPVVPQKQNDMKTSSMQQKAFEEERERLFAKGRTNPMICGLEQILEERERLFAKGRNNSMICGLEQILKTAIDGDTHTFLATRFELNGLGTGYWPDSKMVKLVFVKSDTHSGILLSGVQDNESVRIYYVDTLPIATNGCLGALSPYIVSEPLESCRVNLDYEAVTHVKIVVKHDVDANKYHHGHGYLISNEVIEVQIPRPRYCKLDCCSMYASRVSPFCGAHHAHQLLATQTKDDRCCEDDHCYHRNHSPRKGSRRIARHKLTMPHKISK